MTDFPKGRFAWYELMTTDPAGAVAFYGGIAGWDTQEWADGPEPYTMWVNGEAPIGGVIQLPDEAVQQGAPSHWLAHITTPDVAATSARAEELGGKVWHRMDVPTVGSFAIMVDPHGAIFSAFQPEGEAPGHDGTPALGEFSWNELMANDWQEAWAFYSDLFGWTEDSQMDMGPDGLYHMFKGPGRLLGGMMTKPAMVPAPAWLFYINVPSVSAALESVKALGGQVLNGPMEIPGGDTIAQCLDPQGAAFALHGKA